MNSRKVILFFLIAALLVTSLSGCISIPKSKYYEIPAEEVISVQFYCLDGLDHTFYHDPIPYDPVHTVPEEDTAAFLEDFAQLEFRDYIIIPLLPFAIDPSFSYGNWVVRVNFINDEYTLYSSYGFGATFDTEGNYISSSSYSCDKFELGQLILKYGGRKPKEPEPSAYEL